MPFPSYTDFLDEITNELVYNYNFTINSEISGEYFIFYINTIQITQFKLSLYDRLLKYQDYTGVKTYFYNYITSFLVMAGGGGGGTGFIAKRDNPRIVI